MKNDEKNKGAVSRVLKNKFYLLILFLIVLTGFCLVRDFVIKSVIGTVATSVTGAPTSVGGLSLSIVRQSVKISALRMYNPKGFPREVMLDIPKVSVDFDLGALLTGKIHLKQLELAIVEIGMVKNKEGKLNFDSLKIAGETSDDKAKKKPAKELAMQIDSVSLGMGRLVSKDYSVEGPPVVKVYDINLKKAYKNIKSAEQLAALIIAEPLKAAGIQGLKVYGAMMLTGVAVLPVAAVFTFTGKDYASKTFNVSMARAYDAGLQAVKTAGKLKSENRPGGVISAEVNGARVTVKLKKLSETSIQVTISARKFGLPQAEIASGVMYRLSEGLQ